MPPKRKLNHSESGPIADPSSSKPTKSRRISTGDSPANVEKRGAIFKKHCPKNILERVDRVMTQRFFMVDRRRDGQALKEDFSVLGSTGNVYTVIIGPRPSCDCPDALKGNHCKHILFVFLKVLQVPSSSGHWYQKALLTSELEEIFRDARPAPNSVTNQRLRTMYAQATNKTPTTSISSSEAVSENRKIPEEDDDCPICYETMHKVPMNDLVFCEDSCGRPLHKVCFDQWRSTQRSKGSGLSCVWCRAKWSITGSSSTSNATSSGSVATVNHEGYLNLGVAAGLSPVRDTSSYHRWYSSNSRSRHRHGWEEFEDLFDL